MAKGRKFGTPLQQGDLDRRASVSNSKLGIEHTGSIRRKKTDSIRGSKRARDIFVKVEESVPLPSNVATEEREESALPLEQPSPAKKSKAVPQGRELKKQQTDTDLPSLPKREFLAFCKDWPKNKGKLQQNIGDYIDVMFSKDERGKPLYEKIGEHKKELLEMVLSYGVKRNDAKFFQGVFCHYQSAASITSGNVGSSGTREKLAPFISQALDAKSFDIIKLLCFDGVTLASFDCSGVFIGYQADKSRFGLNFDAMDKTYISAIDEAISGNRTELNYFLEFVEVRQSANAKAPIPHILERKYGKAQDTALHMAAKRGNLELYEYLRGKGGSQYVKNKEGKTPLQIAQSSNPEKDAVSESTMRTPVKGLRGRALTAAVTRAFEKGQGTGRG